MRDERIDLDISYHVEGLPDDSQRFSRAANWVREHFELVRLKASIALVDDATIHQLNRDHLQHDWPTDVISFVFEADQGRIEGEIIASVETAGKLHQQAGWSQADELLLYIVHGLLHLAGLGDANESERQEMRKCEQACLVALGVPGAESHIARWKDVAY